MSYNGTMMNTRTLKGFTALIAGILLISGYSSFAAAPAPAITITPSAHGATLSWTMPQDASQYEVRFSMQAIDQVNFQNATLATQGGSDGHNATVSNLSSNTQYFFGLKITNVLGEDTFSFTNTTTLNDNLPPSAVIGFSGSAHVQSVTLNWTAPQGNDLSEYDVRVSDVLIDNQNFAQATHVQGAPAPLSGQAQTMDVGGLSPGTQYYFAIKILDTVGQSSPLATVSITTTQNGGGGGGGVVPVASVTDLLATSSQNGVNLSWITPQDNSLSQFIVRYSTSALTPANFDQGASVIAPLPMPGQTQTIHIGNLLDTQLYYFGVIAVNVVGTQSSLVTASTTTGVGVPPVMNVNATRVSATAATLSWNTPTSTTLAQFEIRYSTSALTDINFASGTLVGNAPFPISGSAQSMQINNIAQNMQWYFGIKVINVVGRASALATTSLSAQSNPPGGGGSGGGTGYYTGGSSSVSSTATSTSSSTNPVGSATTTQHGVTLTIPLGTIPTQTIFLESPLSEGVRFVLEPKNLYLKEGEIIQIVVKGMTNELNLTRAHMTMLYPQDILALDTVDYRGGWSPLFNNENKDNASFGIFSRGLTRTDVSQKESFVALFTFHALKEGKGIIEAGRGESVMITVLPRDNTPLVAVPQFLSANIFGALDLFHISPLVAEIISFLLVITLTLFIVMRRVNNKE